MKVSYDEDVDAAYLELSAKKPDGASELSDGIIVHTTSKGELVGIEILDASERFPIKTLYSYELLGQFAAHDVAKTGKAASRSRSG